MDFDFSTPLSGKKRSLDMFFFQELLFDYLENRLDRDRQTSMTEFLASNDDARELHEKMVFAMEYCKTLRGLKVNPEAAEAIIHQKGALQKILERLDWRQWPDSNRWVAEGFGLALVISVVIAVFPWDRVKIPGLSGPKTLVEIQTQPQAALEAPQEEFEPPDPAPAEPPPDTSPPKIEPVPGSAPPVVTENLVTPDNTLQKPQVVKIKEPALSGFVYRIDIFVPDLGIVTGQVVSKIEGLGGKKSGKVRLGWRREDGSSYFHFSLPSKSEQDLFNYLKPLGEFKLIKDSHWRVMPEGQVRVILQMYKTKTPDTPPEPEAALDPETAPSPETGVESEATSEPVLAPDETPSPSPSPSPTQEAN